MEAAPPADRSAKVCLRADGMENAMDGLIGLASFMSPASVVLIWSRLTADGRVKRILRCMAIVVVIVIAFLFGLIALLEGLCNGSWLKGFTACVAVPAFVSRSAPWIVPLSLHALATVSVATFVVCAWIELSSARRRRAEHSGN